MGCKDCYYEGAGIVFCHEVCRRPECWACADERFFETHPLEAAERDYEDAATRALWAEECGYEDADALAAEAIAAYRLLSRLRREAGFKPD